MTWVLLSVLIGIVIVFYVVLFFVSKVSIPTHGYQETLGFPMVIPFVLSILFPFGIILSVVLITSSIGTEYNWRTIRTMLICSESRFKLLGAKLITVGILMLIGMVVGLAAGFIMSLITTAIGGYTFDFSFATGGYFWDQFLQFWRTFYVLIPYVLLGFLFAVIGRSSIPGFVLGIGEFFLESMIAGLLRLAGGWIAEIPDYLLTVNVNAINTLSDVAPKVPVVGDPSQMPGLPHAFVTVAIYNLVFIMIAFYLFRKRDLTG
jgi:ABC-type transport system involved in multi-copper enzyme maturation permease subunit